MPRRRRDASAPPPPPPSRSTSPVFGGLVTPDRPPQRLQPGEVAATVRWTELRPHKRFRRRGRAPRSRGRSVDGAAAPRPPVRRRLAFEGLPVPSSPPPSPSPQ